jgi:NADPH:quinone reductase-like Zn-dependent oxidoreductase
MEAIDTASPDSQARIAAMKAAVCDRPGTPDVIRVVEVATPTVPADGVLVRVQAASVNPVDLFALAPVRHAARWAAARGKPQPEVMGHDFSGTVAAVGNAVTMFRVGDEVFGSHTGAFAEYLSVPERAGIVRKPANVSFPEAAAVPVAALTALQAVRDHGRMRPGQRVLVNGASGGVGTFAVQVAKALGGEVTAVCSSGKAATARELGADHVIDYTREDFTEGDRRYDLVIDIAGSRPWSRCIRVMEPHATLVITGASSQIHSAWRMLAHMAATRLAAVPGSRRAAGFIARVTPDDLGVLGDMLATGRIRPVIDGGYPLGEVAAACRQLSAGHARGKIVIDMEAAT